ncbi:MAG: acyl-CoA/acyl-ACP dehydrogenase [Rhodospirillaceae bacterium]|jgi:alkylation response protein AidB-like acyl-CoA dehydrogenase|nr:acyl-CoA/acyl-ACP dehydrogenase [Rhodospirillaceae bacterium]MBT5458829.1 acyl-CoA/acyl-ACP dehydrogenase [Rhodospirillaceae bacterium]
MTAKIDLENLVHEIGPGFAAKAAERDETDGFVDDNYDVLKEHGILSAMVPAELGGGGVSHSEMAAFIRALAHYCSSTALALSMHQQLVAAAVFNYRNDRPGWQVLEKVAANDLVLVSTGANDWMESNGEMERTDGGYLVSAKKPFASGSPRGNVLVTSAPYEDPTEGWQVLHFPVPITSDGVSGMDDWQTMGMRATGSQTIVLDKVFVPDEAIVLKRPQGEYHPLWNVVLTVAMPLIMSAYMGVAEAAAVIATKAARKRRGQPETPLLLGEMINNLTTAQMAVDGMVAITNNWEFAPETDTANKILVRKTIAANAILATVEKAMETAGGIGFYRKTGLERLLRDAHAVRYHPLPEKRQQHFTGRLALDLDPIGDTLDPKLRVAAA